VNTKGRAVIGKLNVDDNPGVPMRYNVLGIHTFPVFRDGELAEKIVDATTKQALQTSIDAQL